MSRSLTAFPPRPPSPNLAPQRTAGRCQRRDPAAGRQIYQDIQLFSREGQKLTEEHTQLRDNCSTGQRPNPQA